MSSQNKRKKISAEAFAKKSIGLHYVEKAALVKLANNMKDIETGECYKAIPNVADEYGTSGKAMQRGMYGRTNRKTGQIYYPGLEARGIIFAINGKKGGGFYYDEEGKRHGKTTRWRINVPVFLKYLSEKDARRLRQRLGMNITDEADHKSDHESDQNQPSVRPNDGMSPTICENESDTVSDKYLKNSDLELNQTLNKTEGARSLSQTSKPKPADKENRKKHPQVKKLQSHVARKASWILFKSWPLKELSDALKEEAPIEDSDLLRVAEKLIGRISDSTSGESAGDVLCTNLISHVRGNLTERADEQRQQVFIRELQERQKADEHQRQRERREEKEAAERLKDNPFGDQHELEPEEAFR